MPQHSSKNYHAYEYEYFLNDQQYRWENKGFEEDTPLDYPLWYTPKKPVTCSCEFCWEYVYYTNYKRWPYNTRKSLIESYFTPEEILLTIQEHLQEKFRSCYQDWGCYNPVDRHILQRKITKILSPQSTHIYIPKEIEDLGLSECIVKVLYEKLGVEVKKLHDLAEQNEKIAILSRYGLTLDDFMKMHREREESLKLVKPEKPVLLPKQRFVKVKLSDIQPDTVPFRSLHL
jgi:hypothetical protein